MGIFRASDSEIFVSATVGGSKIRGAFEIQYLTGIELAPGLVDLAFCDEPAFALAVKRKETISAGVVEEDAVDARRTCMRERVWVEARPPLSGGTQRRRAYKSVLRAPQR